jgi:hypothetical protein
MPIQIVEQGDGLSAMISGLYNGSFKCTSPFLHDRQDSCDGKLNEYLRPLRRSLPVVGMNMKIDYQRQVIGGELRKSCANHVGGANLNWTTIECFIERAHSEVCGKRAKAGDWRRDVVESMPREWPAPKRVSPIVRVTRDNGGQMRRLQKEGVSQEMLGLPMSFSFGET